MTGVVNYAPNPHSVELRALPIPEIGPDDVLLKVDAVGVCGSDIHQWTGQHSWAVNYPCVLGHEFTGTVAQTGANVSGFAVGDRVVSETAANIDLDSPYTRQGNYNLDPSRLGFGNGVDGAMAQYVRVPRRTLHTIPDGISAELAAVTEPCCVAYNAVCVGQSVMPGDRVLVIGPGPIGILCALMARLAGAGTVIMAGTPNDVARMNIAKEVGVDTTLSEGVVDYVAGLGDGLGVEVAIDAAGVSATLDLALKTTRPGGMIVKVGWGRDPLGFSLDPLVLKAITLKGSFSHNWPVWQRVIRMMASGQLDPSPIITRVAPLSEWETGFHSMHEGQDVKVVLRP